MTLTGFLYISRRFKSVSINGETHYNPNFSHSRLRLPTRTNSLIRLRK